MRSPADMEFIQIDITNACNMRCSNCTRFCGNHRKPFFMDFETFQRAVDSLDGFDGVTGIIGGEPTLHPEFERFAGYMREKFGKPSGGDALLYPQKDFIHSIHRREFESGVLRERSDGSHFVKKHGAGLWSNMSGTYRKYYEVIQDTFSVEYLNDHINPSYHQPGLFSRKDLDIPDDEWVRLRDRCWIQNTWSAAITPKGAFFCEIAGALDMLFDGPGGWKIEPGWWKRKPEEFADQLHWCELCGFALEGRTFTRDSQEETDDVSPRLYEMLKSTGSPKLKSGHINPVKITDGAIDDDSKPEDKRFIVGDRYIAKYEDRFHEKNSILFQMEYSELVIADGDGFGERLNQAISQGSNQPINQAINQESNRGINQAVNQESNPALSRDRDSGKMLSDSRGRDSGKISADGRDKDSGKISADSREKDSGKMSSDSWDKDSGKMPAAAEAGWLLLKQKEGIAADDLKTIIGKRIFNPGSLHVGDGWIFFCKGALSLRNIGFDRIAHMTSMDELAKSWQQEKVIRISDIEEKTALRRDSIQPGKRYAIWGAGMLGEYFEEMAELSGAKVSMVCDKSEDKIGKPFGKVTICAPGELRKRPGDYDFLMIAHHLRFEEIEREALSMGIPKEKLLLPFEV